MHPAKAPSAHNHPRDHAAANYRSRGSLRPSPKSIRRNRSSQVITIAVLFVTFLAGAITGAIVLVGAAICREESNAPLLRKADPRAVPATRRIVGFHTDVP